jgi:hypothetical protein
VKAARFSDAQKAFIVKQGADGMPVADICRKAGISHAHLSLQVSSRLTGRARTNASRRFAKRAFATAFMFCCGARAGGSTKRRQGGFIANWSCNYATRRAKAPGQGQTARRSQSRHPVERDLGDGLIPILTLSNPWLPSRGVRWT